MSLKLLIKLKNFVIHRNSIFVIKYGVYYSLIGFYLILIRRRERSYIVISEMQLSEQSILKLIIIDACNYV